MPTRHRRSALSRLEVLVVLAVSIALMAMLAPVLAQVGGSSMASVSRNNLRRLHEVHECYAADWSGRQWTAVPDDLAEYGTNPQTACANYAELYDDYPPFLVGFGCEELSHVLWGIWPCDSSGVHLTLPVAFAAGAALTGHGAFRLPNGWGLHEYLSNRFYDPFFYAPDDEPIYGLVEPAFALECEFVQDINIVTSSYVLSPAAMYHPDVLRAPSQGGFQHPFAFAEGLTSPAVSQVQFAALKSRLIEHHWLRNPPAPCNEGFSEPWGELYADCNPYLFNHGAEARPLTLFFDGSVERLRTGDVVADDLLVLKASGGVDGLWSRDTPLGPSGYFGEHSHDGTIVSHHILTTGGIRGRDRLGTFLNSGRRN